MDEDVSDSPSDTEPEVRPARSILKRTASVEGLSDRPRSVSRARSVVIKEPTEGRRSRPQSLEQAGAVDSPRSGSGWKINRLAEVD